MRPRPARSYGGRVSEGSQWEQWAGARRVLATVLPPVLVVYVAVYATRGPNEPQLPDPSTGGWVAVGVASLALFWRLRWPLQVWLVTLVLTVAGTVSDGYVSRSVPALLVAVYTVAAWRSWRAAVAVALASASLLLPVSALVAAGSPFSDGTYALLAVGGMACAVGTAVHNQRAFLGAAHERALSAERTREEEAQRRVVEERLRIARELHDVVAHHISVVNVQAGVARHLLATDLPAADAALGTVREAAALVLRETGSILGLLRTSDDGTAVEPAPGIDGLGRLVEGSRRAGLTVEWTVSGAPRPLAPAADLAAYRLVQEALTNAQRHGTGRAVLLVDWSGPGLLLQVSNPVRDEPPSTPGAGRPGGHGLVGMRERVSAAGGRLDVGRSGESFTVRAELPADLPAARVEPVARSGCSA